MTSNQVSGNCKEHRSTASSVDREKYPSGGLAQTDICIYLTVRFALISSVWLCFLCFTENEMIDGLASARRNIRLHFFPRVYLEALG